MSSAPEGRIEHLRSELLNPFIVRSFHTAPPGRQSLGRTLPQGFTLGYFRLFPPGRKASIVWLFFRLKSREKAPSISLGAFSRIARPYAARRWLTNGLLGVLVLFSSGNWKVSTSRCIPEASLASSAQAITV